MRELFLEKKTKRVILGKERNMQKECVRDRGGEKGEREREIEREREGERERESKIKLHLLEGTHAKSFSIRANPPVTKPQADLRKRLIFAKGSGDKYILLLMV